MHPSQYPSFAAPSAPKHRHGAIVAAILVLGVVCVVLALSLAGLAALQSGDAGHYDHYEYGYGYDYGSSYDPDACNVMGIGLRGDIYTYLPPPDPNYPALDATSSEDVVSWIREAEADDDVMAILLEVDSYGGSPVAADEIADALSRAEKPTVALIRGAGDSAAYWAATGADHIFATANSDVGSIGVTSSFIDNVIRNESEGLRYNQLSSGKYKDMFSPDKPLTEEERALVMRDVNKVFENFVQTVARNRNLPIDKVRELADGSTMLGQDAKEHGLIDSVGTLYDVEDYLSAELGEDAAVCW